MKKIKRVQNDFNLDIDTKKEFEIFSKNNDLIDDRISFSEKFRQLKRTMVMTCSILGGLLVCSVGVNITGIVLESLNNFDEQTKVFRLSYKIAKNFFTKEEMSIDTICLSYDIDYYSIFNVYLVSNSFYGQIYLNNMMLDFSFEYNVDGYIYSYDVLDTNFIWEFDDINDKDIDISFYENGKVINTFSFKL